MITRHHPVDRSDSRRPKVGKENTDINRSYLLSVSTKFWKHPLLYQRRTNDYWIPLDLFCFCYFLQWEMFSIYSFIFKIQFYQIKDFFRVGSNHLVYYSWQQALYQLDLQYTVLSVSSCPFLLLQMIVEILISRCTRKEIINQRLTRKKKRTVYN